MWSSKKRKRAIDTIITYGKPHKGWLVRGVLGTIGVVLFRLAMPWPLRGVLELVFSRSSEGSKMLVDYYPQWGEPLLMLCVTYFFIALGLGLSEMVQRVNIMKFAANTVHDMRSAAVKGIGSGQRKKAVATGDIISRIIGDSARIKAGLSGILVHGLQNGLLFILVCVVMLYISITLGLIFLIAGVVALYIGLRTSTPVAKMSSKQRGKEGDYAAALQEGIDFGVVDKQMEEINWSSARKEVRTTRLIARSSLMVHLVLAVAVGLALWFGALGVKEGMIEPGGLFIFIAYALTVHRRMIQVGRQAARSGKVLACVERVSVFLGGKGQAEPSERGEGAADNDKGEPLTTGLRLERVKLESADAKEKRPRLRRTDLTIKPNSRIVVLGNIGAGKSSLLKLLTGADSPDKGRVSWDEEDMSSGVGGLLARVAYLPQEPIFPPTHLWKLLGLAKGEELDASAEETLRKVGAWKVVECLPKGIKSKVGSSTVSRSQARMLRLGGILLGDSSSVWVLDNPTQGLERVKARKSLDEIFKRAEKRAVVIALSEPIKLKSFDRVLFLRGGKVRFDGTPSEWEEWKSAEKKAS